MARAMVSDADIIAQIPAARRRAHAARRREPHAAAVRYSPRTRMLQLRLTNGVAISIPIAIIPGLNGVNDSDAADVSLSPSGVGLTWERLDIDLSVAGVVKLVLGQRAIAQAAGVAAGAVKSPAKSAAARLNGKKGGRPRKAS